MIRLIVSDLDGTILGSEHRVLEKTEAAIQSFRQQGGLFSLSTGRLALSGEIVARQLDLDAPSVYFNGAMIKQISEPAPLWYQAMPRTLVQEIIGSCQSAGLATELYSTAGFYIEEMTPVISYHADILGVKPYLERLEPSLVKFQDILTGSHEWLKVVVICEDNQQKAKVLDLQRGLRGKCKFASASGPSKEAEHITFFNITHPQVCKGAALRRLLDMLKIPKEEIMAMGDSGNDEALFEAAGLKIAMGNATDRLKSLADHIVSSVDDHGAAEAIEKFCLERV